MRRILCIAMLMMATPIPGTAQTPQRSPAEEATQAARALFLAVAEARWADAAALVHPATLEETRLRHLEHARRAPELERPETAEELMRSDPAMPRVVAEYQASRSAEMRRRFPPPRLSDGFARVETLAELEALSAKEMFARFLEATDWRSLAARQIERGGGTITPEGRAALPRNRHEVLGAVPDGPDAAYVVYRIIHVGDGPREVQTLRMERTPEGWLARNIYFAGHGGVGMQIVEWEGRPLTTPGNP
ncbi:MAG TPA: hypothetical protein VF647_18115 [Longimicrobium sp.]|jgi:hypothetical protein